MSCNEEGKTGKRARMQEQDISAGGAKTPFPEGRAKEGELKEGEKGAPCQEGV